MRLLIIFFLFLLTTTAFAEHKFKKIDTCYHWQQDWQLQAKLNHAAKNNEELLFYNNQVIYCWRTPIGAQSNWEDHGDYLVRIKLKPDAKIVHMKRQYNVATTNQFGDAIYSNDNRWHEYTITPDAVESWSVYHPGMIEELKADLQYHLDGKAVENDVFYPFMYYNLNWINSTIPDIIDEHEDQINKAQIFGKNKDQHFETTVSMSFHEYLDFDSGERKYREPLMIKVVSATYGLNIDPNFTDNALDNATKYCDGKRTCDYKVHPKFIGDPAKGEDKSFHIKWMCGDEEFEELIDEPAKGKFVKLKCTNFKD